MQKIISTLLLIVGVIHLLPMTGVLGAAKLTELYGVPIQHSDLEILMRHRAVLLGAVGLLLIYSVFDAKVQLVSLIVGVFSVLSFLWLAIGTGNYNSLIKRVVVADVVALVCLIVTAVLYFTQQRALR